MSAFKKMMDVRSILEAGMRSLNMTGEIVVRSGGSKVACWVGQPSEQDVVVDVQVFDSRGAAE